MILPMVPHAYGVFLFRQYFMEMPDSLYDQPESMDVGISDFRKIYVPLGKAHVYYIRCILFLSQTGIPIYGLLL